MKEKYEKEIKDLETSESEAKSKYCDAKSKILENEETIIGLKSNIKTLENQAYEYKEVINSLHFIFHLFILNIFS